MVKLTAVNPGERQRRTPPVEVMVDNTGHRFVATTTLACNAVNREI